MQPKLSAAGATSQTASSNCNKPRRVAFFLTTLLPFASSLSSISPTPRRVHRHGVAASASTGFRKGKIMRLSSTRIQAYGKGSEIWPECNEEPIQLAASFPGGAIPQPALDLLASDSSTLPSTETSTTESQIDSLSAASSIQSTKGSKRRAVRRTLSHLLQSAAQASTRRARSSTTNENETYGVPTPAIDKGPAILALALLGTRCVDPMHVVEAVGMSVYFVLLASWCAAPKVGSTEFHPIVNMPSLPSKGHVPNLITNPLGASLTNSRVYRTWLRAGALLGILLPTVALTQLILGSKVPAINSMLEWINVGNVGELTRIVGGPMFLLCCQALSEAVARTALLPLPLRILIPVSYNTLRLSSLRSWAFPAAASVVPNSLRMLGIANLSYWYANLFLFLIPVGVVRYLRAHFYSVEAVEVTVRKGGEGSVGLMP